MSEQTTGERGGHEALIVGGVLVDEPELAVERGEHGRLAEKDSRLVELPRQEVNPGVITPEWEAQQLHDQAEAARLQVAAAYQPGGYYDGGKTPDGRPIMAQPVYRSDGSDTGYRVKIVPSPGDKVGDLPPLPRPTPAPKRRWGQRLLDWMGGR